MQSTVFIINGLLLYGWRKIDKSFLYLPYSIGHVNINLKDMGIRPKIFEFYRRQVGFFFFLFKLVNVCCLSFHEKKSKKLLFLCTLIFLIFPVFPTWLWLFSTYSTAKIFAHFLTESIWTWSMERQRDRIVSNPGMLQGLKILRGPSSKGEIASWLRGQQV